MNASVVVFVTLAFSLGTMKVKLNEHLFFFFFFKNHGPRSSDSTLRILPCPPKPKPIGEGFTQTNSKMEGRIAAARRAGDGGGKDALHEARRDVLGDENSLIGVAVTRLRTCVNTCRTAHFKMRFSLSIRLISKLTHIEEGEKRSLWNLRKDGSVTGGLWVHRCAASSQRVGVFALPAYRA